MADDNRDEGIYVEEEEEEIDESVSIRHMQRHGWGRMLIVCTRRTNR